jgi:predicted dehydrogenase
MSEQTSADPADKLDVVTVGGGMITHDQILPSIYQMQRLGRIGSIKICALNSAPLRALAEAERFREAFPGQAFEPFPALDSPPEQMHPDLYKDVIASMPPHNLVVVAVPDHVHDIVIRTALEHDQHVMAVKPLVPTYAQAEAIDALARGRGLMVGVEYHKRFDRRALDARLQYRNGRFGEFKCGEARMIEPYYYRHSNFQNWFTKENSDPFTYVGCHYVDLVYFITGLRPVEVSVRGVEGKFPNGNVGYMWSAGTVVWENGAVLTLLDGLGYPDEGAGTNDQGLTMYCEGENCGAIIKHNDQFRGVSHGYIDRRAGAAFRYVSPDYFRLVPWEGDGLKPIGYGYDSIEAIAMAAVRANSAAAGLSADEALAARQKTLQEIDQRGLLATPANSWINELVTEAARQSIERNGQQAVIDYAGTPSVRLRNGIS